MEKNHLPWIIIVILVFAISVISFFLYQALREQEGTTVIIPGDIGYRKPVSSNPMPVKELKPLIPYSHPDPIISYLKDPLGIDPPEVDTDAIKIRYGKIIAIKDSLIMALQTTRIYSDTVNDSCAEVRAVIHDSVRDNRLLAGRQVEFWNYRPISLKTVIIKKKNLLTWAGNAYFGTDLIEYPNLIYKVNGEIELGFWRLKGRIEPSVSIEPHPRIGLTVKVGFGLWGK